MVDWDFPENWSKKGVLLFERFLAIMGQRAKPVNFWGCTPLFGQFFGQFPPIASGWLEVRVSLPPLGSIWALDTQGVNLMEDP